MSQSNQPFEWIELELLPLPSHVLTHPKKLLWWNPQTRQLIGEGAAEVLVLVEQAKSNGSIVGAGDSCLEITNPLEKPTELAAILAQYYWVIPRPVDAPGSLSSEAIPNHTLQ